MNINLIAAYWSLDLLPCENLPEIALEALQMGLDSPSLRILAGERISVMSDLKPLFERSLSELGTTIPSPHEGAMQIAQHHAKSVVSGKVQPVEGARRIIQEAYYQIDGLNELVTFAALEDQYEEFSDKRHKDYYGEEYCKKVLRETEKEIIEEAKKLLASNNDA